MASHAQNPVLTEAARVFRAAFSQSQSGVQPTGFYLKNDDDYAMSWPALEQLCAALSLDDNLILLIEAALLMDDLPLFETLTEAVGEARMVDVTDNYFGLSAFWVYSAIACLTHFLSLVSWEAWERTREERLFSEAEAEFWEIDWAPPTRQHHLAILFLLHFQGGIPATSLLQKCIQHGFSSYYPALLGLGAEFSADDLYRARLTPEQLADLLNAGVMPMMQSTASPEDWAYLVQQLIDDHQNGE